MNKGDVCCKPQEKTNRVLSFDVFDTVLIRVWATPKDVFLDVGRQLKMAKYVVSEPEEWCECRQRAESLLREGGEVDPTIEAIYCQIGELWSLDDVVLRQALRCEIEAELRSVRVNPMMKELIDHEHGLGLRVLYLSDMYLPSTVIERMLRACQVWESGDRLYVSCESGATKFNGTLFSYCLDQEKLRPTQVRHFGDHEYSDVLVPRKLGLEAVPVRDTGLNKNELRILECKTVPKRIASLVAGASRLARLAGKCETREQKIIWDTGASVVGPAFFGFVVSCMTQAVERHLARLYFVSRDGQILLRMAQAINESWSFPVECRYLYGSRQAWFLPAITKLRDDDLEWILENTHFLSVASVCRRVDIAPKEIEKYLSVNGFLEQEWRRDLNAAERSQLCNVFRNNEVKAIIEQKAKQRRQSTLGYLKQEDVSKGAPFGIVDIGWNGRLQRSLGRILHAGGCYPSGGTDGFYFCLSRRTRTFPIDRLDAFFCDGELLSHRKRDKLCPPVLIELFAAADHGGVKGYMHDGSRYVPEFRGLVQEGRNEWPVLIQQGGAVEFVRQLTSVLGQGEYRANECEFVAEAALSSFVECPSLDEAKVYGGQHSEEDQGGGGALELAPPLHLRDALRYLLTGELVHHCVWIEGSRRRGNSLVHVVLSRRILEIRRRIIFLKSQLNWYVNRGLMRLGVSGV